jgi:hypothetical protein
VAGPDVPVLVPSFVRRPQHEAPTVVVVSGVVLVLAAMTGIGILLAEARRAGLSPRRRG